MLHANSRLFLTSLFFGLLLLASSASAQFRASLRGTVTDPRARRFPARRSL